jgi:hypothetical protein
VTQVTRWTRIVLSLDLLLSLVAGCVLFFLSSHTDAYFAWTIKLPLTAAFLGAGYLGAVGALIPSYWIRDWRRVRIIVVMGFALTGVTALVTLWHLGEFHLGAGSGSARFAGWAWLVVYLTIPVLLAAVFVAQERGGGRSEYDPVEPLGPAVRGVFVAQAVVTTIVGIGLVVWPSGFDELWPWPLPALAAGAVGAWLLTIAAGSWWTLRERDWAAIRGSAPGLMAYLLFIIVASLRYTSTFDAHRWQFWTFFGAVALTLFGFAACAWDQERRRFELSTDGARPRRHERVTSPKE